MITLSPWERLISGTTGYSLKPIRATEAADFYWCTDIKTTEITKAYFGGMHTSKLSDAVGPSIFLGCECSRCTRAIYAFSRANAIDRITNIKSFDNRWRGRDWSDPRICHECKRELQDAEQAPHLEAWRKIEARQQELSYMPYHEYLRTPEWKATREQAIRRARGCCQTCASTNRLNVHHRTYLRRGHEYSTDLIVLCESCHELFHRNGRLADGGRAAA